MAPSGDVEVDADRRDARLVIEVRAAFAGPVPLRVSDRIGAAGGTLDAEARRLRAEMPCAS
jgi:hypothetical protein